MEYEILKLATAGALTNTNSQIKTDKLLLTVISLG